MSQAPVKLSVVGLKAYYLTERGPVQAVDGVNLSLLEGESLGVVGESACGKSSLGAALLRSMQRPGKIMGGSVVLAGQDITLLTDSYFDRNIRWKKIAMVFQGAMNALDPVYSVESQLAEILQEHGYKGNFKDKIKEALKQVDLDLSVAARYPHELSGGMKQRVVIAMALLLEPDLLIADEPTTALDVLVQSEIIKLLQKLQQEKGVSVILISHDLGLVSQIAHKIGIMYAGQMIEVGSTDDVYRRPKHPYTQALIAAVPNLKSKDKKINFITGSPPSLLAPGQGCRFYPRCPHAMEKCKQDPPEFKTESGYVRCWLYEKDDK